MRVVFDTNVVVSAFLSSTGAPAQLLRRWESGDFDLLISDPILTEYARVLNYKHVAAHHHLTSEQVDDIIRGFRQFAVLVLPTLVLEVIREDPPDNRFVECAVGGEAAYIITGDVHLLRLQEYRGIQILTPAAFLALLSHLP